MKISKLFIAIILLLPSLIYSQSKDYIDIEKIDLEMLINILDLDNGIQITVENETFKFKDVVPSYISEGVKSYKLIDNKNRASFLSIHGSNLSFQINSFKKLSVQRNSSNYSIKQIEKSLDSCTEVIERDQSRVNRATGFCMSDDCIGTANIDVLVGYDPNHFDESTILTEIANELMWGNDANDNSGVDIHFFLRGTVQVDLSGSNTVEDAYDEVILGFNNKNNEAWLELINQSADVLAVVGPESFTGDSGGIGSRPSESHLENPYKIRNSLLSVSKISAIQSQNTMVHEIGHNLGLKHDIQNSNSGIGLCSVGNGYVNETENWVTIMSYSNSDNSCTGCDRIQRWSNPNINYLGDPVGDSNSNNAFILNKSGCIISNISELQDDVIWTYSSEEWIQCEPITFKWYAVNSLLGNLVEFQYSEDGNNWVTIWSGNAEVENQFEWAFESVTQSEFSVRFISEGITLYETQIIDVVLSDTPCYSSAPCFDIVYVDYYYKCGDNIIKVTVGEQVYLGGRNCSSNDSNTPIIVDSTNNNSNNSDNGPGDPGDPVVDGTNTTNTINPGIDVPVINENDECQECVKELHRKIQLIKAAQNGNN